MESLCDELYYGKISGIEIQPDRTKEYLTASQEASDALNALRVTLSQEQRTLLEQATSKLSAEHVVLLKQMYAKGIYFGTRLLSEAYTDALHDQYDRSRRQKGEDHHGGRHDG